MAPLKGTGPLNPDWLAGSGHEELLGLLEDVVDELEVFVSMDEDDADERVDVIQVLEEMGWLVLCVNVTVELAGVVLVALDADFLLEFSVSLVG